MKIIYPSFEVLDNINVDPMKYIEKIARVCYKSEENITDDSHIKMITRLRENGHTAMLEHFRFIVEVPLYFYDTILKMNPKFLEMTNYDERYVISGSARAFVELANGLSDMTDLYEKSYLQVVCAAISKYYGCYNLLGDTYGSINTDSVKVLEIWHLCRDNGEYDAHAWLSAKFICDRGVSHELVRHRVASFAQESTRYCNYATKDGEITFIKPCFWDDELDTEKQRNMIYWEVSCLQAERTYLKLIKMGATPQEARSTLPTSVKTEIVVTATMKEWIHIFKLRADGITGKPHPQMSELMIPLKQQCADKGLIPNYDHM